MNPFAQIKTFCLKSFILASAYIAILCFVLFICIFLEYTSSYSWILFFETIWEPLPYAKQV